MEYHSVSAKSGVADENQNTEKLSHIEKAYTTILSELGEDVKREGLLRTPLRAAKAMQFLTKGYKETIQGKDTFFSF